MNASRESNPDVRFRRPDRSGEVEQILVTVRQIQLRTAELQQNIQRFVDLLDEELPQYRETADAGDTFLNWLRPLLPWPSTILERPVHEGNHRLADLRYQIVSHELRGPRRN